jgi:hypothetical protein
MTNYDMDVEVSSFIYLFLLLSHSYHFLFQLADQVVGIRAERLLQISITRELAGDAEDDEEGEEQIGTEEEEARPIIPNVQQAHRPLRRVIKKKNAKKRITRQRH